MTVTKMHWVQQGWDSMGPACGAGYDLRRTSTRSAVTCIRCRTLAKKYSID